jgi:hypothetical protein
VRMAVERPCLALRQGAMVGVGSPNVALRSPWLRDVAPLGLESGKKCPVSTFQPAPWSRSALDASLPLHHLPASAEGQAPWNREPIAGSAAPRSSGSRPGIITGDARRAGLGGHPSVFEKGLGW